MEIKHCIDCEKKLSRPDAKRCQKCYILWLKNNCKFFNHPDRSGSRNPNFNKDNTHNNKCIVCQKRISKNAEYCSSCARKGKFKFNIKRKWFCQDCGKEIKNRYSKRCEECNYRWLTGSNNGNWKDGITSLSRLIRGLPQYKQWINGVFKRDNFTCQHCKQYGGNLEVHHINLFKNISENFLQEYNQFSLYKDKETLVRLAMNYSYFWDINNGITLCRICHKETFSKKYTNKIF